jgi:hypothetical protein
VTVTPLEGDLNATIASAVSARVEAEVIRALAGDEVIGRYIAAALNQQVEVGGSYKRTKATFLQATLQSAFQEMTKRAIAKVLEEDAALIEDEIRKAIRRQAHGFAESIVTNLTQQAAKGYGISVELRLPGQRD